MGCLTLGGCSCGDGGDPPIIIVDPPDGFDDWKSRTRGYDTLIAILEYQSSFDVGPVPAQMPALISSYGFRLGSNIVADEIGTNGYAELIPTIRQLGGNGSCEIRTVGLSQPDICAAMFIPFGFVGGSSATQPFSPVVVGPGWQVRAARGKFAIVEGVPRFLPVVSISGKIGIRIRLQRVTG